MRTIASALAALCCAAAPAFSQNVGFVTNLKGDAAIDGASRPPLLAEVSKGQKITLAREATISVMYAASGKEYVLKGPGEWLVKDNEIAASSGMPPVVRHTEWRTTNKTLESVAQTSAASVRMRSIAQPKGLPVMLFPSGGRVATLQPTFRWRADAAPGAAELAVYVPGEEKAVHSAIAGDGSYRLPVALKPDTEYVWTLASAGQEVGSARFRTLASDALQNVAAHRPSDRAEFSDRLLFALMLQELGAQQEARESWLRLSQERGDLPELCDARQMIARAVAAAAAAVALQSAAGTPVAFVADVSGSATIEGDGRLAFLTELEPGMRLFLGSGARAAITFARSGTEYNASGPGEFVVNADELRVEKGPTPVRHEVPAVADMSVVTRTARSATASLRMRSARPPGERADSGPLEYPVASRVATLQPMLRWKPLPSHDVTVSLKDEIGKELWSGKASATAVRPGVKLSAATRYRWTVMSAGSVVGEATFETLPPERLARVEKSKSAAHSFSERVMHVMLLQDVGAEQDAAAAWADLAKERPDLPELARLAH